MIDRLLLILNEGKLCLKAVVFLQLGIQVAKTDSLPNSDSPIRLWPRHGEISYLAISEECVGP